MPLVGLHCSSYYSTSCISRKFGEHQGAPSGEGAFHTKVFTNKILGRLREVWPEALFLLDTSIPLWDTSNGWRMR